MDNADILHIVSQMNGEVIDRLMEEDPIKVSQFVALVMKELADPSNDFNDFRKFQQFTEYSLNPTAHYAALVSANNFLRSKRKPVGGR